MHHIPFHERRLSITTESAYRGRHIRHQKKSQKHEPIIVLKFLTSSPPTFTSAVATGLENNYGVGPLMAHSHALEAQHAPQCMSLIITQ